MQGQAHLSSCFKVIEQTVALNFLTETLAAAQWIFPNICFHLCLKVSLIFNCMACALLFIKRALFFQVHCYKKFRNNICLNRRFICIFNNGKHHIWKKTHKILPTGNFECLSEYKFGERVNLVFS